MLSGVSDMYLSIFENMQCAISTWQLINSFIPKMYLVFKSTNIIYGNFLGLNRLKWVGQVHHCSLKCTSLEKKSLEHILGNKLNIKNVVKHKALTKYSTQFHTFLSLTNLKSVNETPCQHMNLPSLMFSSLSASWPRTVISLFLLTSHSAPQHNVSVCKQTRLNVCYEGYRGNENPHFSCQIFIFIFYFADSGFGGCEYIIKWNYSFKDLFLGSKLWNTQLIFTIRYERWKTSCVSFTLVTISFC